MDEETRAELVNPSEGHPSIDAGPPRFSCRDLAETADPRAMHTRLGAIDVVASDGR